MRLTSDFYAEIAKEMMKSDVASRVAEEYSNRFGVSVKTIFAKASLHGYKSGKKRRENRGKIDPELHLHLWNIAAIYNTVPDRIKSPNREADIPLQVAVDMYLDSFENLETTPQLPSLSRIAQIFRLWQISKKYTRNPLAKRELKSLYPNDVHQYDTSVCRFYLDPKSRIIPIAKSEEYKNKSVKEHKRRLVRHIVVDHYSGAFYVAYTFLQKITNYAEFLFDAWREKDGGYIFHGAPRMLILDHDCGLRSHAMMRLYKNLNIEVPPGQPYHPWEKGTVENFMRTWERHFERRFLFQKSASIDEINEWAYKYAIKFSSEKIHRRHQHTRFDFWNEHITDHLLEIPDKTTFFQLLYSNPKPCKVNHSGQFMYENVKYDVPDLRNCWIDCIVHPNLYQKDKSVTVFWPSSKDSQEMFLNCEMKKYTILPTLSDQAGFGANAVHFGDYSTVEATESETNLKKAKDIDVSALNLRPFDHLDTNIEFMNKTGKPVEISDEKIMKTTPLNYKPVQAKLSLVDRLGRRLTDQEVEYIDELNQSIFNEIDLSELQKVFEAGLKQKTKKNEA